MSWNYSNYHSCDKISEITEYFVSLWGMGEILKNKNKDKGKGKKNPEKDSLIITFRKEGVGLCTEYLAREQSHRNGPIIDNKMNLTVPSIVWKAWVVNTVLHITLVRSWSEQYWSPHFKAYTDVIRRFYLLWIQKRISRKKMLFVEKQRWRAANVASCGKGCYKWESGQLFSICTETVTCEHTVTVRLMLKIRTTFLPSGQLSWWLLDYHHGKFRQMSPGLRSVVGLHDLLCLAFLQLVSS